MFKCCSKACRHGSHKPLGAVKAIRETIAAKFIKNNQTHIAELFQGITTVFWVLAHLVVAALWSG